MSSIGAPIVRVIDGRDIRFPKATPRDYVELGDILWERQRTALIEDLDAAGVPHGEYRFERLAELRQRKGLGGLVIQWLYTLPGAIAMLERSLERAGDGVTLESLGLNDLELVELALEVGCVPKPDDKKKGDEDADPTTAGIESTGGTMPA